MIGRRLGPYEVLSTLGEGGMGQVYRARDTQLDRDVALKLLPDAFVSDPERLARFEREAKILASLNHPNIAQIHGLQQADGHQALVMEFVDGEDLSQRIARGRVPLDEALPIARQIAEALEAAHEQGIIHRDLKPANIKVRPDGTVKVLDFGLAKALDPAAGNRQPAADALANSPTITSPAQTMRGVILGTAAYMSPEQARGKPVDKRTDIWAFGCVLYEMLTGRQAFGGNDVSATIAEVLKSEPDWDHLRSDTPSSIRRLLRRCLHKDPIDRLRDIGDARAELREAATDRTAGKSSSGRRATPPIWVAAAAVVLGMALGVVGERLRAPGDHARGDRVRQYRQDLGGDHPRAAALSGDGSTLAYLTDGSIRLRRLTTPDWTTVAEASPASGNGIALSPDGGWLAFVPSLSPPHLAKVPASGGLEVPLFDVPEVTLGVSWDVPSQILYGAGSDGIWMGDAAGGGARRVIEVADGQLAAQPQLLPGRNAVLFTLGATDRSWDDAQVVVQDLGTGKRTLVVDGGHGGRYLASGHLVFGRRDTILATAFDVRTLETVGEPLQILTGVANPSAFGELSLAASDDGTLAYLPFDNALLRQLVWVDRAGRREPLVWPAPAYYSAPALSPDGRRLATGVTRDGNMDVWVFDFDRRTENRLSSRPGFDWYPLWTPDGTRIVFTTQQTGFNLAIASADGSGETESLTRGPFAQAFSWIPDGRSLLASTGVAGDIVRVDLLHPTERVAILATDAGESEPMLSPDGKWLAYVSNESRRREVYVRPFPDVTKGRWVVSSDGGTSPRWRGDGQELFYRSGDRMMAVSFGSGTPPALGHPAVLFEGRFADYLFGRYYDVTPDGRRFLMIASAAQGESDSYSIIIMENWFEELKRRVPIP